MPQINITINVNEGIYLRDPLETTLGKKIIKYAIILIDEVGFEDFNFKKLAIAMESTEASVYRYFENKYKLLAYLVAWYWDYMHFMIIMDTRNIKDARIKLQIMISTLVNALDNTTAPDYIDQTKLHSLVIENASKVYHNKNVDNLKKEGFYNNLRKLVDTMADIIGEVNPEFAYPKALATNIVELSLNNEYYMLHLTHLTDFHGQKNIDAAQETIKMIQYYIDRLL